MKPEDQIILDRLLSVEAWAAEQEAATVVELLAIYERARKDALNRLESAGYNTDSYRRIEQVLDEIEANILALEGQYTDKIANTSSRVGYTTLVETEKALSWDGLVHPFHNTAMTVAQMEALILKSDNIGGLTLPEWVRSSIKAPVDELKEKAREAMLLGKNPKDVVKELIKTVKSDETKETTANYIRSVVRTFVAEAGTEARHKVYEANKNVIQKYEWVAAMEAGSPSGRGTCHRCAALDGIQNENISDFPGIPLHMNCRCILSTVTVPWSELLGVPYEEGAERMKVGEQIYWDPKLQANRKYGVGRPVKERVNLPSYVYSDKTYTDWFFNHNKEWQINSVGPGRYDFIHRGKTETEKKNRFRGMAVFSKDYRKVVNNKNRDLPNNKKKVGGFILGDSVTLNVLDDLPRKTFTNKKLFD